MDFNAHAKPSAANVLFSQFIRYDRLYEMTKFALYNSNSTHVNIFIDSYSIIRKLYRMGSNLQIDDSYVIASCLINLAIHLRAYFETRHRITSKIFIIYGGARPKNAISYVPSYNDRNILQEDSNSYLLELVKDNLEVLNILTPYLHEIYSVVDYANEFSVITSTLIDKLSADEDKKRTPNIIYSKDTLAYQLVAFKPYTFLYRPKKSYSSDNSWVVTKSTLYNAYRNGELGLTSIINTDLHVQMFSIYQAISGVRSRGLKSIKTANTALTSLDQAVKDNIFFNGYNASALTNSTPNPFQRLFENSPKVNYMEVQNRFYAVDLPYQTMLFSQTPEASSIYSNIIDLYNPDEVKAINNKYFQMFSLDLNRV